MAPQTEADGGPQESKVRLPVRLKTDLQRQKGDRIVSKLGEDAVFADAVPEDSNVEPMSETSGGSGAQGGL